VRSTVIWRPAWPAGWSCCASPRCRPIPNTRQTAGAPRSGWWTNSTASAFKAQARDTAGHPMVTARSGPADARRSTGAVLWPLRRATGRSARQMDNAALRTGAAEGFGWCRAHLRPRCCRRQGATDDLCGSRARLGEDQRPPAGGDHGAVRGRRGVWLAQSGAVSRGPPRARSRPTWRWCATPTCGTPQPRRSPRGCAGWSMTR
jgi:hypothetical protein